jgi:arylsulfatase A-like enzyme
MLAALDEAIGQILGALDETGRRKNAFVFFSSDNGGPAPGKVTSNGPLRAGKGSVYEGGVQVVACASWDGHIKPGTVVNAPMHMVDLYPTLLRVAGASLQQEKPLDGIDILPCLTGDKPSARNEILHNTTPTGGALRLGDWKLVVAKSSPPTGDQEAQKAKKKKKARSAGADQYELFNLAQDPSEKINLAEKEPQKLKELRTRYETLAREAAPPKNTEADPNGPPAKK